MAHVLDIVLEWPIYINDDDEVTCYKDGCIEPNFIPWPRRKTFGDLAQDLLNHIHKFHGLAHHSDDYVACGENDGQGHFCTQERGHKGYHADTKNGYHGSMFGNNAWHDEQHKSHYGACTRCAATNESERCTDPECPPYGYQLVHPFED